MEDVLREKLRSEKRRWSTRARNLADALRTAKKHRGRCLSDAYVEPPGEMRWRCAEGHAWNADVLSVAGGRWCEVCRREWLERTAAAQRAKARAHASQPPKRRGGRGWVSGYPHLVAEWHPTKNGDLTPDVVRWGSSRTIWWRCRHGHEWQAKPTRRTRYGEGCPYCSGKRVSATNCLAARHPRIARQWHPTKNGKLTARDVTAGSGRSAWWKCPKGADHEWQAKISDRQKGDCPFCSGHRPSATTCLAARFPRVAAEWHPTKNRPLTPSQVTPFSARKVWWRCGEGHVWEALVSARARGDGCPYCSGHRVSSTNSLAARAPKTARLWHPTRNGSLTPRDVTMYSGRVVWWRCPEGPDHVWQDQVASQSMHKRCAFCCNRRLSVTNRLSTMAPAVAREWHPTRNGGLTPRDVVYSSKLRAWWKCAKGHVWATKVTYRTVGGSGCPSCKVPGRKRGRRV